MQRYYVENENIRASIKSLLALAFLPSDEVSDAFDELVANYPLQLSSIVNYFEDTYIEPRNRRGQRRQPLFNISMWNVKERQEKGPPRTNNQLESWHNAFQSSRETFHLSIFRFIEALQREEVLQRANLIQIKQGRDIIKRVKRYVAVNDRITIV